MKVYIIGKVTTKTFSADFERFLAAEAELIKAGHEVVNIFRDTTAKYDSIENEVQHRIALLIDCNAVLVLPDWNESDHCVLELAIACQTGMQVMPANNTIIPERISIYCKK